jgi:hypothetical protein
VKERLVPASSHRTTYCSRRIFDANLGDLAFSGRFAGVHAVDAELVSDCSIHVVAPG